MTNKAIEYIIDTIIFLAVLLIMYGLYKTKEEYKNAYIRTTHDNAQLMQTNRSLEKSNINILKNCTEIILQK